MPTPYMGPHQQDQPEEPDFLARLVRAPRQGWASLLALLVMAATVGIAVDEATWVGHVAGTRTTQTSFLPFALVLATLTGFLLARTRLRTLAAHVVGSIVGAAYLLYAIAGAVSGAPALEHRLRAVNEAINAYFWETLVLGIRSHETAVFLLLVGGLLWAAGQLGAFALFRRDRPMPAIVLGAVALLLNMSLTTREQLPHLVVFASAALLLLVRLNLELEVEGWHSRRMADSSSASDLFLRRGTTFVAGIVVLSVLLAATASSAPLARAWRDVDARLIDLGYGINRWVGGVSGPIRGSVNLFGPTQTLRDVWESSHQLVFTARVGDEGSYYWRGATYDFFDGRTWHQLDAVTNRVEPGTVMLAGTAESMSSIAGRRQLGVSITSVSLGGDNMVVPETPLVADRATELITHRGDGPFLGLKLAEGLYEGTQYNAIALVPITGGADAVTANMLAASGTDYPQWISRYLQVRPGSVGDLTYAEAERIVRALPQNKRNPYHIAEAIQQWFWADGGFEYNTDITGLCVGVNTIDCFLETKTGFCERFATAMTMMLRTQGIPARYVVGYLPGQLMADGTWQVDASASHAWVEVYFPGYGWYRFDPTPGNFPNGQQPTRLAEGGPLPAATPGSGGFLGRGETEGENFDLPIGGEQVPIQPGEQVAPPSESPLLPLLAVGLATALGAAFLVGRRRAGAALDAGRAYDGLTTFARRLGHGPRPTQTVLEYTGQLAELVPAVAGDLQTLATAKVEATYSSGHRTRTVLERVRLAYRRVRLGLLRLALRRPAALGPSITLIRRRR